MRQPRMCLFRWGRVIGICRLAVFLMLVCVWLLPPAGIAGMQIPEQVTVGLAVDQNWIELVLPEAGELISGEGERMVLEPGVHRLRWEPNGVVLGNLRVAEEDLRVVTRNVGSLLSYRDVLYRGEFHILRGEQGLTLVNIVALEDYLRGVVPKEIPPGWSMEALKAQAVAARTYTIMRVGAHREEGFALCASTHCHVYGGASAEHPTTNQAVASTKGEVLFFAGKPINAVYHSSSGGYTENSENVWGWISPYLQGVPDMDHSPYAVWETELAWTDFTAKILEAYPDLGYIRTVIPAAYGVSGRISQIYLDGGEGSQKISGERFRHIFGLRSTLFTLVFEGKNGQMFYQPGDILPRFLSRSGEDGSTPAELPFPDGGLFSQKPETFRPERVRMVGSGWGHGVGLSQWGSKNLADEGKNYRDILGYYYKEVRIQAAFPPS